MDDDDDLPVLSDTEAAIALVLAECPAGAMLFASSSGSSSSGSSSSSGGSGSGVGGGGSNSAPAGSAAEQKPLPCALVHALHAVVHHATEVDVELERLRLSHTIRVLKLPAFGDERLLLRAEDYADALAASGCCDAAARVARQALPVCTSMHLRTAELQRALGGSGGGGGSSGSRLPPTTSAVEARAICEALRKAGWLVPAHQAAHAEAHAAAPGEAPILADADSWLWSLPQAGRVLYALSKCRAEVLKVLHKQHFHRAMLYTVERAAAVRKVLGEGKLDLRYVLRDLVGKRLVEKTEATAGVVVELTPAGVQQAANASSSARKRKR